MEESQLSAMTIGNHDGVTKQFREQCDFYCVRDVVLVRVGILSSKVGGGESQCFFLGMYPEISGYFGGWRKFLGYPMWSKSPKWSRNVFRNTQTCIWTRKIAFGAPAAHQRWKWTKNKILKTRFAKISGYFQNRKKNTRLMMSIVDCSTISWS